MPLDGTDGLQTAAEHRLEDLLREFAAEGQTAVLSGHAESSIVRYAERVGAGLVVVGRHRRSGLAEFMHGSTATDVLESSPCSVLVSRGAPQIASVADTAGTFASASPPA